MKISLGWLGLLPVAVGLMVVTWLPGCGGTASNADSQLDGSFSGAYSSTNAIVTITTNGVIFATNTEMIVGPMITTNSGAPVTALNLTQSQSQLRAVDNRGDVFTGTFTIAYANGGMVQMEGQTGAGTSVQIVGYLEAAGSAAWLNASWIEPNLTGSMYGTAQVTPFSPTNPAVWKP